MDTYLEIAEEILRVVKRPLSALQMLREAYERGIAPPHLRGRTQHKTLGARLSEDILRNRDRSRFYRTAPGRFLLKELSEDPSIPEGLRRPIVARRRRRQLAQKRALAFDRSLIEGSAISSPNVDMKLIFDLICKGEYHYTTSGQERTKDDVVVWSFTIIIKNGQVLSYRQGHYREDRDTFMRQRTIGFYSPVAEYDMTFFNQGDHGIVTSGIRALANDLDLNDHQIWSTLENFSELKSFVYPKVGNSHDLLGLVCFSCPDWLDPTSKRLAINDLEWLDLRRPLNNHDDFDPWSKAVILDAIQLVNELN